MSDPKEGNLEPRQGNPKLSWNVKGLPVERREAITRAAHRNAESVAEFVWAACAERIERLRQPGATHQATRQEQLPALPEATQVDEMANLTSLFGIVCQLAATEATKGNRQLLAQARAVLRQRLQRSMGLSGG